MEIIQHIPLQRFVANECVLMGLQDPPGVYFRRSRFYSGQIDEAVQGNTYVGYATTEEHDSVLECRW